MFHHWEQNVWLTVACFGFCVLVVELLCCHFHASGWKRPGFLFSRTSWFFDCWCQKYEVHNLGLPFLVGLSLCLRSSLTKQHDIVITKINIFMPPYSRQLVTKDNSNYKIGFLIGGTGKEVVRALKICHTTQFVAVKGAWTWRNGHQGF